MGRGVGAGVMTDSIALFAIYMLYRRAPDVCMGRKDNASKKLMSHNESAFYNYKQKKLSFCL
jgi:hypothetical protein